MMRKFKLLSREKIITSVYAFSGLKCMVLVGTERPKLIKLPGRKIKSVTLLAFLEQNPRVVMMLNESPMLGLSNLRSALQALQLRESMIRTHCFLRWLASDYDLGDALTKKWPDCRIMPYWSFEAFGNEAVVRGFWSNIYCCEEERKERPDSSECHWPSQGLTTRFFLVGWCNFHLLAVRLFACWRSGLRKGPVVLLAASPKPWMRWILRDPWKRQQCGCALGWAIGGLGFDW